MARVGKGRTQFRITVDDRVIAAYDEAADRNGMTRYEVVLAVLDAIADRLPTVRVADERLTRQERVRAFRRAVRR